MGVGVEVGEGNVRRSANYSNEFKWQCSFTNLFSAHLISLKLTIFDSVSWQLNC